jgi:hypothetical protein
MKTNAHKTANTTDNKEVQIVIYLASKVNML